MKTILLTLRTILLLFFFSFFVRASYAQNVNFNWAKQIGGNGWGTGYISTDNAGNVVNGGNFNGNLDFDPGPATYNLTHTGENAVYIFKLNTSGNFQWAVKIGEGDYTLQLDAVTTDALGNIYSTGFFEGTVDFDPGPNTYNLTKGPSLGTDMFILKLDPAGNFLWAKQMVGATGSVWPQHIHVDKGGNVLTYGLLNFTIYTPYAIDFDPGPGTFMLTNFSGDDAFISKLDTDGNFVWAKNLKVMNSPFSGTITRSLVTDALGNVIVTGDFNGEMDFDPGPGISILTSDSFSEGYVCKLNADGTFLWVKQLAVLEKENFCRAGSLNTDGAGNIYHSGFFTGTVDFDPGPGVFNLVTGRIKDAVFLSCLTPEGNFLWAKKISGESPAEAYFPTTKLSSAGNLITAGIFSGTVDFDPGPGFFYLSAFDSIDVFVSCHSKTGDFLWAKQIGGIRSDRVYDNALCLDANDNVYTSGNFGGTADFDPGTGTFNLTSIGVLDMFVQKMSLCINSTASNITASACGKYILNGKVYTSSGTYGQLLSNAANCDSLITLNLTIFPEPKPNLGPDNAVCFNKPSIISPGIFNTYLWQDNSTGPSLNVKIPGTYWVAVSDNNNCTSTDSIKITKAFCEPIYIPNAFTPNNDALNNLFKPIIPNPVQGYSFMVFNRYGQKIFETRDYRNGWDGTFKGKPQSAGSYVYHIKFTDNAGQETVENGSVLLIR